MLLKEWFKFEFIEYSIWYKFKDSLYKIYKVVRNMENLGEFEIEHSKISLLDTFLY